ncbi:hypothetical protein BCR35DRAFT_308655 [Leucosporidium creatinivorum]|uniref:Uncharacterized protein n=1 Tax=Leucosporidium creatinivorum TaxID=106004 RepID=A0A1Y2E072_9BASI|nr:hypothetical protein BCR35DRAFT_308655 [Leucosporidium creatinivorum]
MSQLHLCSAGRAARRSPRLVKDPSALHFDLSFAYPSPPACSLRRWRSLAVSSFSSPGRARTPSSPSSANSPSPSSPVPAPSESPSPSSPTPYPGYPSSPCSSPSTPKPKPPPSLPIPTPPSFPLLSSASPRVVVLSSVRQGFTLLHWMTRSTKSTTRRSSVVRWLLPRREGGARRRRTAPALIVGDFRACPSCRRRRRG